MNLTKLTAQRTATGPDASQSGTEAITSVSSHGGLDDLERLAQSGDLEQVETSTEQQVGKLDGLLLEMIPSEGSRDGSASSSHSFGMCRRKGALTKGRGSFFA